jgi:UDP-3-O-[3-hydroxymyristoyl] N-acetylglucosamine deacetylase
VRDAKILRQAGYALGSSMENSITVHEDRILNPGGLRYEDEFVRHKLLDAVGDLALCGLPIYGRFRSYKRRPRAQRAGAARPVRRESQLRDRYGGRPSLAFDALDDLPDGHQGNGHICGRSAKGSLRHSFELICQ